MRIRRFLVLGLLAAALAVPTASALAQAAAGTVRDAATRLPIRGAFLEVLDTAGARVTASLSDSLGRFTLSLVPGRYSLRVEAMGYADAIADTLELLPGAERRLDLRLRPQPIELPPVGVQTAPRCKLRRDTAGSVLAAWQEARKALRLAEWSMRESGLVMVTRTYTRRDFRSFVWRDSVGVDTVFREPPFTPLPLANARSDGVFQVRGATLSFYAPGPDYVLSDDFLESHCFSLRRSGQRVDLDFFPIGRGEGQIRGTLWLDRNARALQQIEFRFSDITHPLTVRDAGGTLDFAHTTEGYAIIRRWLVRAPVYAHGARQVTVRGGEVIKSWRAEPKPAE